MRQSSPFWNVNGLYSNADRSIDFSATGSDNDTDVARLRYYGPGVSADLSFERFDHDLEARDFGGWNFNGNNSVGPAFANGGLLLRSGPNDPQTPSSIVVYSEKNLSPGQDFAIRVEEWKANFKGCITDNLRWRLNVFGIDREGYRQVSTLQHCSAAAGNGSNLAGGALPVGGTPVPTADTNLTSQCHVTTQAQHIDWQTTEVTPALELRLGCDTTLEYSHMIRSFTANDQAVNFNYDAAVTSAGELFSLNQPANAAATAAALTPANRQAAIQNLTAGYAVVPDNETQIDRLKFSTKIGSATDLYLLGYAGYNEDLLRDTYRDFNGVDLRITNKAIENNTVTFTSKFYNENTTLPLSPLSPYATTAIPANNFYQEPYYAGNPAPPPRSPRRSTARSPTSASSTGGVP